MRADLLVTALTQAVVMLGTLLVIALIARFFSASGVGEYSLIRRALYFLQPVILLGITVAVPKYLPQCTEPGERAHIAATGLAIVMAASCATALLALWQQDLFAGWIFGSDGAARLVVSLAAMAVAFGLHSYVYSYFRGVLRIKNANVLDGVNSAVLPLAAVVLCAQYDVAATVLVLAAMMVVFTAMSARDLWNDVLLSRRLGRRADVRRALLGFGIPRIPGDLALAGLLFGAPVLIAHEADLADVGRFAVAQTVMMIPGAALAPLSVLLLPYVSARRAAGDTATVTSQSMTLFHALWDGGVYFSLHVAVLADLIVRVWVGDALLEAASLVRVMMVGVPMYAVYVVFRSVLDASTDRPITAINLVAAFGVFLLAYPLMRVLGVNPVLSGTWAIVVAYMLLGIRTLLGMSRLYELPRLIDAPTVKVLALNIGLAGAVLLCRSWMGVEGMWLLAVEAAAVVVFSAVLWSTRRGWFVTLISWRSASA